MTAKKTKKPRPPAQVAVPIRIELPQAAQVFASGTFNDWSRDTLSLTRNGDGGWHATLQLAPGRYEYRLVVDGEWADVPGAIEAIENAFGTRNAVLIVPVPA